MVFQGPPLTAACSFAVSSNFQLGDLTTLNNYQNPENLSTFQATNSHSYGRHHLPYNEETPGMSNCYQEDDNPSNNGVRSSPDVNYDSSGNPNFSFTSNMFSSLPGWYSRRPTTFSYRLNNSETKSFNSQDAPTTECSAPMYYGQQHNNDDSGYYSSNSVLERDLDHIQPSACSIFPASMNINLSMKMNVDLEAAYTTRHEKYGPRYNMGHFYQPYAISPMAIHKPSTTRPMNPMEPLGCPLAPSQYPESEFNSRMNYNSSAFLDERGMPQFYSCGPFDGHKMTLQPRANNNVSVMKHPYLGSFGNESTNRDLKLLASHFYMDEPNQCRICGRSYARPSTLKIHMRTHSGERPFKCNVCCKTFSQVANLTAHKRIHSGEKPFSCHICHRQFSQSSSVTTHMRTHSGERPYRCHHCSKAFSDSSTLTKHTRVHSGEKPYKCRICLLKFSQSGNLNRHMRVHINSVNSTSES